jgi:hypothetical protein
MSALRPKADIGGRELDVRFVPKADVNSRYLCVVSAGGSASQQCILGRSWVGEWLGSRFMMRRSKEIPAIELGMKVSVRRSTQQRIGVVMRVEGNYVFVRWINSDLGETAEYQAHRDEVTPMVGWL